MASRKTQERLAAGLKRPVQANGAEAGAFEKMMSESRDARQKEQEEAVAARARAGAEAVARWEREQAGVEGLAAALSRLAEAVDHLAMRLALGYGAAQAAGGAGARPEQKPTRAELATPAPAAHASATQEDVRRAVRDAVKAGRGGKAVEVLAAHKAEAVSDLRAEDYGPVLAQLQALAG